MLATTYRTIKFPIITTTIVMLLFGFLCSGFFSKTPMQMSSMNTNITSLQYTTSPCCNFETSQRMDLWQNIILVAHDITRNALILLALLALVFVYSSWFLFQYRSSSFDPLIVQLRMYLIKNFNLILFNHLRLAFAKGILNPKPF